MRTIPSLMPSSARCAGVSRWCVVVAGCVMQALGVAKIVADADQFERVGKRKPPSCRP